MQLIVSGGDPVWYAERNGIGEGLAVMTLQEVAAELARSLNCEVQPDENPYEVKLQGKGYQVVVATFFGGWQATLHLPDHKPQTWFGEAAEMLELRLKAKLSGRDANF